MQFIFCSLYITLANIVMVRHTKFQLEIVYKSSRIVRELNTSLPDLLYLL